MTRQIIRDSICVLGVLAGAMSMGQSAGNEAPAFSPADYPRAGFQVTQSAHTLGDIRIRIVHAKRRKANASAPSYCRAWVEISRGEALFRRILFGDIEPVGHSYGVFVPAKQPSANYFVLVKEGDYDGHVLLVNGDGTVADLLGGSFFVTSDRRFLVSEYSSDSSGLAVFDLHAHRVMLETTEIPYIQNWYEDSAGYFFTESEWSGGSGEPHEKGDVANRLDLKEMKIVTSSVGPSKLQSATRVKYEFDARQHEDCVSR